MTQYGALGRLARTLVAVAIAALTFAWAIGQVREGRQLARRDQYEVARMTNNMKTVCVGRFLIDLPRNAVVELARPRIDGFEINTFNESEDEFLARLVNRQDRLAEAPGHAGGKNLELAKDVKMQGGFYGKIFVHGRKVSEGTQARGLELERYRYESVAVEALVHRNGISIDIEASNYSAGEVANIFRLVQQLVPNPDNRPPPEPGYCLHLAYVRDPLTADQGEEITMFARLPDHPDIQFMLISAAGTKPESKSLLERDRADGWLGLFDQRITKVRAAKRSLGGIEGDELVERFVEENHAVVFSHWWEANGSADNVMLPHVSLTMDTGKGEDGPVPSTISENAALGLWDKVLSSVRLRPTVVKHLWSMQLHPARVTKGRMTVVSPCIRSSQPGRCVPPVVGASGASPRTGRRRRSMRHLAACRTDGRTCLYGRSAVASSFPWHGCNRFSCQSLRSKRAVGAPCAPFATKTA